MNKRFNKFIILCIILGLLTMLTLVVSMIKGTLANPDEYTLLTGTDLTCTSTDLICTSTDINNSSLLESEKESEEITEEKGSISGLLWEDGNGELETDWDGLYNGEEQPLTDYDVYLYEIDNLSKYIAVTQTDINGAYIFDNLDPGDYVLSIVSSVIDGNEYLLPDEFTEDCKFEADFNTDLSTAYTEIIPLETGGSVEEINAGIRVMTASTYANNPKTILLENVGEANIFDIVEDTYSNSRWAVIRTKEEANGEKYVYLILIDYIYERSPFGENNKYNESSLRNRMNGSYYKSSFKNILAIAVKPNLKINPDGSHTLLNILTDPTPTPAKKDDKDIFFAPSYGDMVAWINKGNVNSTNFNIPSDHPIALYFYKGSLPHGTRFHCRTAMPNIKHVTGVSLKSGTSGMLDKGIDCSGDNVFDAPAVWVKAGSTTTEYKIKIHYVNTKYEPIETDESISITSGNPIMQSSVTIKDIPNYKYKEWEKTPNGTISGGYPTIPADEVKDITDIYLIYEMEIKLANVMVSKEVKGEFPNKSKEFEFTVFLKDNKGDKLITGTTFNYIISAVTDTENGEHANGVLIIDEYGKASFKLKHGQAIIISEIPADAKIKIEETKYNDYDTSFTDNAGNGNTSNETEFSIVDANGIKLRIFEFLNEYKTEAVPGGVVDDFRRMVSLPIFTVIFIVSVCVTVRLAKKRISVK